MSSTVAIPVPTRQFLELAEFLKQEGDLRDPVEVVSQAIDYFIDKASWKQDDLLVTAQDRGYQWKNLFLPSGTQLRLSYKGTYHYAVVEGDQLIHNGLATSPSVLANSVTGSNRNAWKTLWIKRPDDKDWALADGLRQSQSRSGAELLAALRSAAASK